MLKKERELPILRLLDEIWHHVMHDRAKKLTAARKAETEGVRWTSALTKDFITAKQWARTNTVRISAHCLQLLIDNRYNEQITSAVALFKAMVLSATSTSPPATAAARNTRSMVFLVATHWLLSTPVISLPPTTFLPPCPLRRGWRSTKHRCR
jgi:hypothetical protein